MSLEPLRQAYLERARLGAEAALTQARTEAAALVESARREADALMAEARRQGEENADADVARERALAGRHARAVLLTAQRDAYGELRRRALQAGLALRGRPEHRALVRRLVTQARAQLGPGARIEVDPGGQGGIVAREGARRVDYTMVALVERSLESLGGAVEQLWT